METSTTVRYMFEDSPIGMCAVTIDGTVVRRNAACDEFFAATASSIFAVAGEQRTELAEAMRSVHTGSARTFRLTVTPSAGQAVEVSGIPMRGGSGDLMLHLFDVSDRLIRERELREAAENDALTGLRNLRSFNRTLEARLANRPAGTLLMIDLDGFKAVNDTRGHKAGDAVLIAVAQALRETIGERDLAARIGGDEFAVLLACEGSLAYDTALLLISRIAAAAGDASRGVRVGASVGLATLSANVAASALVERADRAMYAAKRAGKGRCVSADLSAQARHAS